MWRARASWMRHTFISRAGRQSRTAYVGIDAIYHYILGASFDNSPPAVFLACIKAHRVLIAKRLPVLASHHSPVMLDLVV